MRAYSIVAFLIPSLLFPCSDAHAACAIAWTDPTIIASSTPIRGIHIRELHAYSNDARTALGLAAVSWINAGTDNSLIKAGAVTEIRTALEEAYTKKGVAVPVWTDPTLTPNVTLIRAIHFTELRAAVEALAGSGFTTSTTTPFFSAQTSLFYWNITVTNQSCDKSALPAFRVFVINFPGCSVSPCAYIFDDGAPPYFQYNQAIPYGGKINLAVSYFSGHRVPVNMSGVTYKVQAVAPSAQPVASGITANIPPSSVSTNQSGPPRLAPINGATLISATLQSATPQCWVVQYSSPLNPTWKQFVGIKLCTTATYGTPRRTWSLYDAGPPETVILPTQDPGRVYRTVMVP